VASVLRLRRVAGLILLATALTALSQPYAPAAPETSTTEIRTEAGLRAALDELEARYEKICVRIGNARFGLMSGVAGSQAALDAARADLRAVYADPSLASLLEIWTRRTTVTSDPTLTRRVHIWDTSRTAAEYTLDPATNALEDELFALFANARFTVGDSTLSRAEVETLVRVDPDPARRRAAYEALAGLGRSVQGRMMALLHHRSDRILQTRPKYYHHLLYGADDIDPLWIFNLMERLASRTRLPYLALVDSMKKAIGQPRLAPWDLDYAMEKLSEKRGAAALIRERFGDGKTGDLATRLLESLGFGPTRLPGRVVVEKAPSPAIGLTIAIPTDFRILVAGGGSTAGADPLAAFDDLLRQYGKGLQAMYTAVDAPMLKGYPWVPGTRNEAYAEGMGAAIAGFARDPLFLTRIVKLKQDEAELIAADQRDRALLRFRRTLLQLGMEFVLYVNPDADLDERYRIIVEKSLAVNMPPEDTPVWAADPLLVTRPVYGADEMIAGSIAAEVENRVRETFGDRRLSGKTAAWLIEHCYANGESLSLDLRLAAAIDGGYDFDKFLATLGIETSND